MAELPAGYTLPDTTYLLWPSYQVVGELRVVPIGATSHPAAFLFRLKNTVRLTLALAQLLPFPTDH